MKAYSSENIRKITKTGNGSYYVIIPKEMMEKLGWREKQKVKLALKGRSIIIKDWKK